MGRKRQTVYANMCADFLHQGHQNLIRIGAELGELTIGLLTDEAIEAYKDTPHFRYEQRREALVETEGVSHVVPQGLNDLAVNLRTLRPDFFLHGDDWRSGPQMEVRKEVLEVLAEWGGELVEPAYTSGISSTMIKARLMEKRTALPTFQPECKSD